MAAGQHCRLQALFSYPAWLAARFLKLDVHAELDALPFSGQEAADVFFCSGIQLCTKYSGIGLPAVSMSRA